MVHLSHDLMENCEESHTHTRTHALAHKHTHTQHTHTQTVLHAYEHVFSDNIIHEHA